MSGDGLQSSLLWWQWSLLRLTPKPPDHYSSVCVHTQTLLYFDGLFPVWSVVLPDPYQSGEGHVISGGMLCGGLWWRGHVTTA